MSSNTLTSFSPHWIGLHNSAVWVFSLKTYLRLSFSLACIFIYSTLNFPLKVERSWRRRGQRGRAEQTTAGIRGQSEGTLKTMAPVYAQMASRFRGREAPSEKYFVIGTQFGTQCSLLLLLNTQPCRLFLSLNTQQRRLLFYSLNTPNTVVCFFSVNTQHCRLLVSLNTQCRLLFYSLNTTLSSASFVEHNHVVCIFH